MSKFNDALNKKAVALSYDEASNASPIIVASGMGYLAEKIVEVARANNVPVYEDNSLATMLTQLELGAQVPEELYAAIVDIYIYFLNFKPKTPEEIAAERAAEALDVQIAEDAQKLGDISEEQESEKLAE